MAQKSGRGEEHILTRPNPAAYCPLIPIVAVGVLSVTWRHYFVRGGKANHAMHSLSCRKCSWIESIKLEIFLTMLCYSSKIYAIATIEHLQQLLYFTRKGLHTTATPCCGSIVKAGGKCVRLLANRIILLKGAFKSLRDNNTQLNTITGNLSFANNYKEWQVMVLDDLDGKECYTQTRRLFSDCFGGTETHQPTVVWETTWVTRLTRRVDQIWGPTQT